MYIITGVSSGIGKFLFDKLSFEGSTVYGTYNRNKPREHNKYIQQVDISSIESVRAWYQSIKNEITELVLINNASINYDSFAHKADVDNWNRVIQINLIGTFNVIRTFLPHMRNEKFGRIINFSSVVAQLGIPGTSSYAASKAGLWGLTKTLAKENGSLGITINNVNLGYISTGIIREINIDLQEEIKRDIPSGRFGDPLEIFQTIQYLVQTEYINGTSIDLNGGIF